MILTARELAVRLGLSPKTDYVAVAGLLKILEKQGAVKAAGKRPFLDAEGKQTIGRPSVLYDVPMTLTLTVPETDPVAAPVAAALVVEAVVESVADAA
jgi:predicted ArsR family transcriptional regulator